MDAGTGWNMLTSVLAHQEPQDTAGQGCSWSETTACESQPSSGPLNVMMLKIRFSYNLTLWNELTLRLDRSRSHLWFAVLRFMLVSTIKLHLNELGAFRKLELFDSSRTACAFGHRASWVAVRAAGWSFRGAEQRTWTGLFLQKQVDDIHWCLS